MVRPGMGDLVGREVHGTGGAVSPGPCRAGTLDQEGTGLLPSIRMRTGPLHGRPFPALPSISHLCSEN